MNELLFILEIIIVFSLLLVSKKLFGKVGIFVWIGFASILANIQVTKTIDLFGISSTLGNVLFSSIFLSTDILTECYGVKEGRKGVYIGLFSVICYIVISQITLLFIPNDIDIVHTAMVQLFSLSPRVCISSITMFFISNLADVYLYSKLKDIFNDKKMWLRNNLSTIICNCLENFMFVFLAFVFIYPINEIIVLALSTCYIEVIVALCDTPFLYIAKRLKDKKW